MTSTQQNPTRCNADTVLEMNWVIARARGRGCSIVQLTSDKQRPDALRFYESLGFDATHEGFKLKL
ncbi:MAG: GNAT family N-acetyltransferase [Gammaproteobacteria bacterium]|nr:GNAT family N-acetyltransferase [Gammaproteobacteria bacterium]